LAYFHFHLPEDTKKTRLDKFLASELPQYSRSFLAKCELLVNSKSAKASAQVAAGDLVEVKVPALKELKIEAENIPLKILHEDTEILIVEKPSGMVTHPTDHGGNVTGTLVNALMYKNKKLPGEKNRAGLVHRLDKETSGVMVTAKTEEARANLSKQFEKREVQKTYLALVVGRLKNKEGRIEAPIGRDARNHLRRKISTSANAREAITEFRVIEDFTNASLIQVNLLTGRTHQIRVHFNSIQHPVVGDELYGFKGMNTKFKSPRMFLHAWKLQITHPKTGERMEFESELPKELEGVLEKLRK
jgi:23S rRNA pseudouridine1911/1915/1917 synthase